MAKLIVTVTGEKLDKLGNRLASLMNAANQYPDSDRPSMGEVDHINGILFALDALGIPCRVHRNGEEDRYISVEIAGRTFYVSGVREDG